MEHLLSESEEQSIALKKNAKTLAFFVSLFLSEDEKIILPTLPAQARRSYKIFSPAFKMIIDEHERNNLGIELVKAEKMKILLDHYGNADKSIQERVDNNLQEKKQIQKVQIDSNKNLTTEPAAKTISKKNRWTNKKGFRSRGSGYAKKNGSTDKSNRILASNPALVNRAMKHKGRVKTS